LGRARIQVPGNAQAALTFSVLAGDKAPTVKDGYANYTTVNRPERVGLTQFTGYNPVQLVVPIRFEGVIGGAGADIEGDISLLERMAGRGIGADAVGAPPVVRVSVLSSLGVRVPLIPSNYQWSPSNTAAPVWRIETLDWDDDPLRNRAGNRIRQLATVTLQQHVNPTLITRSAAQRAASKKSTKAKKNSGNVTTVKRTVHL
jgi:hypothetical protein